MKRLLLLAMSCLALAACKKDSKDQPKTGEKEQPKYAINFNVSDFTVSTTPPKTTSSSGKQTSAYPPISNYSYKITFLVFNSNGDQVSRVEQRLRDPNKTYRIKNDKRFQLVSTNSFGTLSDTLANGTYTVIALATYDDISINRRSEGTVDGSNPKAYPELKLSDTKIYPDFYQWGSVFYSKSTITVSNSALTSNIELKRITGEIYLTFEDTPAADVARVGVYVDNDAEYINLDTKTPVGNVTTSDVLGTGDFSPINSISVANNLTPVNVVIKTLDKDYKLLMIKTIPSLTVGVNERVYLTGKGFSSSTGIGLSVDPNYNNFRTIRF